MLATHWLALDVAKRFEPLQRAKHGYAVAAELLAHHPLAPAAPAVAVGMAAKQEQDLQIASHKASLGRGRCRNDRVLRTFSRRHCASLSPSAIALSVRCWRSLGDWRVSRA